MSQAHFELSLIKLSVLMNVHNREDPGIMNRGQVKSLASPNIRTKKIAVATQN